MPAALVLAAKVGVRTLPGFRQRFSDEILDCIALVGTLTAPVRVKVAAYLKLIELILRHEDRSQKEATLAAPAVAGDSHAHLFSSIHQWPAVEKM
jgi:hypothetical protein